MEQRHTIMQTEGLSQKQIHNIGHCTVKRLKHRGIYPKLAMYVGVRDYITGQLGGKSVNFYRNRKTGYPRFCSTYILLAIISFPGRGKTNICLPYGAILLAGLQHGTAFCDLNAHSYRITVFIVHTDTVKTLYKAVYDIIKPKPAGCRIRGPCAGIIVSMRDMAVCVGIIPLAWL